MGGATHFIKRCPACGIVWSQCRCPGPKEETKERCPDCAKPKKKDDRTRSR